MKRLYSLLFVILVPLLFLFVFLNLSAPKVYATPVTAVPLAVSAATTSETYATDYPQDLYMADDGRGDFFFNWSWSLESSDSFNTDYKYEGWSSFEIDHSSYGGYAFQTWITLTQDSYDTLSFWVHGGSSGGQIVRMHLINNSTSYTSSVTTFSPQANLWTKVEIPIADLGDPADFDGVVFSEWGGSAEPFYLDDLKFEAVKADRIWIYDEGINLNIATVALPASGVVYTGTQSAVVYSGTVAAEAAFTSTAQPLQISFGDQLHADLVTDFRFLMHGGTVGGQEVQIALAQDGALVSSPYTVTLQPNTWLTVETTMDDFAFGSFFNEIYFTTYRPSGLNQPFFIDNVSMGINKSVPPPTGNLEKYWFDDELVSSLVITSYDPPITTFDVITESGEYTGSVALYGYFGAQGGEVDLFFEDNVYYSGRDYEAIAFRMKGDAAVISQSFLVYLWSDSYTPVTENYFIYSVPDEWTEYVIPLETFGRPTWFNSISWIEANSGNSLGGVWIDDVRLIGSKPELVGSDFVQVDEFPTNFQLYPRDLQTNQAQVPISGTVIGTGVSAITLTVERDDVLLQTITETVVYASSSDTPQFSFTIPVTAELANYDFDLKINRRGVEIDISSAVSVVAGDAYIINGQSNSTAADFLSNEYHEFDADKNQWVRTFGDSSEWESVSISDDNWYIGNGNSGTFGNNVSIYATPASVGQWGMAFGISLTQQTQVPVAIVNGGHPGKSIDWFAPGAQFYYDGPDNYNTFYNYGRLYRRMTAAGLDQNVRGILWYQGEANVFANNYDQGFESLYTAWTRDFPGFEQIYMFQVRDSTCLDVDQGYSGEIQESIRTMGDFYDKVTPVSTNAINGHDGCHYFYTDGYEVVGERIYELVLHDLYGETSLSANGNFYAPNIRYAYFNPNNDQEIILVTRNVSDDLSVDDGAWDDFAINTFPGQLTVTQVVADGNVLTATLNQSPNANPSWMYISYFGRPESGPWITNTRGIGLLAFDFVEVWDEPPTVVTPTGFTTMITENQLTFSWDYDVENCSYVAYESDIPYGSGTATGLPEGSTSYSFTLTEDDMYFWVEAVGCDQTTGVTPQNGIFSFELESG